MTTFPHRLIIPAVLVVALLAPATIASAQDVITLGSISKVSAGQVITVPVYVRDVAGTPLGVDQASGRAIQALAVTVEATSSDVVSILDFQRAGLTSSLVAVYENQVDAGGDRRSWIVSFSETQDPVPFTLDAPAPGEQVADLLVRVRSTFAPGDYVRLRLAPATTVLGNQQGTVVETRANGRLSLVGGLLGPAEIFADGFESGDTSAW